jgi:hypothetical protein
MAKIKLNRGDIYKHIGMVWLFLGEGQDISPVTFDKEYKEKSLCMLLDKCGASKNWRNGEVYTTDSAAEGKDVVYGNIFSMLWKARIKSGGDDDDNSKK